MGHHSAPRASQPSSLPVSRVARRFGGVALAALAVGALGCTKTNDAVTTAPAANAPAATAAPGTAAPGTSPDTKAPGTTETSAPKIPADEVDTYKATVTVDGKDQEMKGIVLCRELEGDKVRLIFGKDDDVDFRLTFSEDLDEGTIELFDGETKTGSGDASIDAEPATARGGAGMNFGFSAGFSFDSGDARGTGTMTGTGACAVSSGSGSTTTSSRPARSTTTSKAKDTPTPSRSIEVPAANATKLAEDLVAIALESFDNEKDWRPGDAWVAAGVPGAKVAGYGNVADGTETIVSGHEVLVDKSSSAAYLGFAVADVNGDCAYGYVRIEEGMPPMGTHKGTEGKCTGAEAAKVLGPALSSK